MPGHPNFPSARAVQGSSPASVQGVAGKPRLLLSQPELGFPRPGTASSTVAGKRPGKPQLLGPRAVDDSMRRLLGNQHRDARKEVLHHVSAVDCAAARHAAQNFLTSFVGMPRDFAPLVDGLVSARHGLTDRDRVERPWMLALDSRRLALNQAMLHVERQRRGRSNAQVANA
eukprot:CAMPEP_0181398966 /NCGR_PEP_ID=MMETSP1110-20121109/1334_1 /TAXON_ID=174948 /ORGANISM="Symbiodinium sp., Strain CCMP421" /LENGTH=171 /DNA_ID=CAMNT_0023520975 /DNA_START=75 /DNA_END=587 /DNA_ORIENTATION=+